MTVYIVYARFPLYLNYWVSDFVDPFKDPDFAIHDKEERMCGIYGWTTKKDIFEEFMKIRTTDYFIYKTKTFKKDEFKSFKKAYKVCKLDRRYFGKSDMVNASGCSIVSTLFEHRNITDADYISFDTIWYRLLGCACEDYYFLSDELTAAIDLIGYTTEYDSMIGGDPSAFLDEEIESRCEFAQYNASYGLTVNGQSYIPMISNQVALFIMMYEPTFLGKQSMSVREWKRGV